MQKYEEYLRLSNKLRFFAPNCHNKDTHSGQYNTADEEFRISQEYDWRFCHLYVAKSQPAIECKEHGCQIVSSMEYDAIPYISRPDEHQAIYHCAEEGSWEVTHVQEAKQ